MRSGDFNGDGRSDILWQNNDGSVAIWEMNGTNVIGSAVVVNQGPSWHVMGVGDYNNDGRSDILWQNEMNGTNLLTDVIIGSPGPTWHA
jgi:hypothetical protein